MDRLCLSIFSLRYSEDIVNIGTRCGAKYIFTIILITALWMHEMCTVIDCNSGRRPVPWLSILTSVPMWAATLMHFGQLWICYTFLSELPTYVNNILHYNIKQSGFVSALPYLFAWLGGSVAGSFSQWLRARGWLSHLTAYRVFNGVTAVGPTLCLLAIILGENNTTTTMTLLVFTMLTNSFLYGGSYMNHVDLAVNFAGTISGVLHTFINISGILTPIVASSLTTGNTPEEWHSVFYIAMAVTMSTYIIYLVFGSVEEQSWNEPSVEPSSAKDESAHQT